MHAHQTRRETEGIVRAAEAACRDFMNGTGGAYNGPMTGVYLRIVAVLQTEKARVELSWCGDTETEGRLDQP